MPKLANVCLTERSYAVLCDPGELDLSTHDFCVIMPLADANGDGITETTGFIKGFEYLCDHQIKDREIPKVLRKATSKDVRAWHFLKRRESETIGVCKEKVAKHNLQMKISSVRFDDRQRKISFNFTADKRVDFRELVKDLAATFKARIELWQIGVRDETRDLGGFGVCGRQLCCCSWLKNFAPVSIRYAKTQDIQFSPTKLSGGCGRLRCCLAFEQQQYVEMGKDAPPIGSMVQTAEYGEARVVDRNLIRRTANIIDGEGKMNVIPFSKIKDIKLTREAERAADQIILEPDETPEDATALLAEERVVIVPTKRAVLPVDDPANIPAEPMVPRTSPRTLATIVPGDERSNEGARENRERPARQGASPDGPDGRNNEARRRGKRGGRNRHNRPDQPRNPGDQQPAAPQGQNGEGRSGQGGSGDGGNRPQRNNNPQRRDRDPRNNNRNRNNQNQQSQSQPPQSRRPTES